MAKLCLAYKWQNWRPSNVVLICITEDKTSWAERITNPTPFNPASAFHTPQQRCPPFIYCRAQAFHGQPDCYLHTIETSGLPDGDKDPTAFTRTLNSAVSHTTECLPPSANPWAQPSQGLTSRYCCCDTRNRARLLISLLLSGSLVGPLLLGLKILGSVPLQHDTKAHLPFFSQHWREFNALIPCFSRSFLFYSLPLTGRDIFLWPYQKSRPSFFLWWITS